MEALQDFQCLRRNQRSRRGGLERTGLGQMRRPRRGVSLQEARVYL